MNAIVWWHLTYAERSIAVAERVAQPKPALYDQSLGIKSLSISTVVSTKHVRKRRNQCAGQTRTIAKPNLTPLQVVVIAVKTSVELVYSSANDTTKSLPFANKPGTYHCDGNGHFGISLGSRPLPLRPSSRQNCYASGCRTWQGAFAENPKTAERLRTVKGLWLVIGPLANAQSWSIGNKRGSSFFVQDSQYRRKGIRLLLYLLAKSTHVWCSGLSSIMWWRMISNSSCSELKVM